MLTIIGCDNLLLLLYNQQPQIMICELFVVLNVVVLFSKKYMYYDGVVNVDYRYSCLTSLSV